jgi:hypothetical protein
MWLLYLALGLAVFGVLVLLTQQVARWERWR